MRSAEPAADGVAATGSEKRRAEDLRTPSFLCRYITAVVLLTCLPGALAQPTYAAALITRNSVAAREPQDYWTGPSDAPVPVTITGGTVIHDARSLQALMKRGDAVIVDVSNAPRRPDNMATGAPWLPLPHPAIPGSLWIPGVGSGEIAASMDAFFREQLASATGGNMGRRVIVYCHERCWLSWNAAKRAIRYGYRHVYWYRDGIEGWRQAGLATVSVKPLP